ncbi:MAG: PAT family beta-lactamase induction signal transducer AmpG [Lysobacterales bacterium]|jgi:PAT family beta-lactamase induction signal transducer AmpG
MAATFILNDSSRARYATGAMMYFAQGIPQGLMAITIPAWLASQGVSASDIASYLAVIILPWVFKLVTGPFMDRFEYLPMGRRRPWVLGAQAGLSVSLLFLMLIENPAEQIGLLMMLGVLVNIFAATQDVAVDGMSIDVTPVNEQGRLNASMSFGKAIGWSATAAASGLLIANYGMKVTAITASSVAFIILILFIFTIERKGERKLPWTEGEAKTRHRDGSTFKSVFKGINQVLWKRASITVMLIMLFEGLVSGFGGALMPIAAIQVFGFTTPQWSSLVAMMGLVGAVVALSLGPAIDRFGAKRMLILTSALVGLHALLIAQTQFLWTDTTYVRVMLSIWIMMIPVVMVCVLALAMTICSRTCSATQFAIYMSVANLGHSLGSKIFGMVSEGNGYTDIYMILSVLVAGMLVMLFLHRHDASENATSGRKAKPRYTMGTTGDGSGMFFSGAMRCPKCRADMEQIEVDGVEIDRCETCKGIWFDEGEVQLLKDKETALLIDTGDEADGEKYNVLDSYPCPRCGGTMIRKVDPTQKHIWYETCSSCDGSFFDAGEFRDLSQLTVSDFFKRLVTPKRE